MSAHDQKIYRLLVNGFSVEARFSVSEVNDVLDRIIDIIMSIRNKKEEKERTIAFFAGPPGAGKSTLALSVEMRAKQRGISASFECLGLDGFHRTREELMNTPVFVDGKRLCLNDIKGAPETFDAEGFVDSVRRVKSEENALWPVYDRRIHDVSPEKTKVKGEILLVEGNWLMLPGIWAEARGACDVTFSVDAEDALLKERLIDRKIRGGKTEEEAALWVERVDSVNVSRYRAQSAPADIRIMRKNGCLVLFNKNIE